MRVFAWICFVPCGPFILEAAEPTTGEPMVAVDLIRDLPIPFFPMLEASVEGHPGRFLVDTGAQTTLLTPAFSDEAGLKRTTREGSIRGGLDTEVLEKNTVETVDLAGIDLTSAFRLKSVRAYLHNLDPLNRLLNSPVAGIIGMDLLEQQNLRLDFPSYRLDFNPQDISGIPVRAVWREKRVYVRVLMEGEPVHFIVDTASSNTMVEPAVWNRIVNGREIHKEERVTLSVSGKKRDQKSFVVMEEFDLAPLMLQQVPIMSGQRNVLGLSVLKRFTVTFLPEKGAIVFTNPAIEDAIQAAKVKPES